MPMSKYCFPKIAGVFLSFGFIKTGLHHGHFTRLVLTFVGDSYLIKHLWTTFILSLPLSLFHFKNSLFVNSFKMKYYLLDTNLFIQILMKQVGIAIWNSQIGCFCFESIRGNKTEMRIWDTLATFFSEKKFSRVWLGFHHGRKFAT